MALLGGCVMADILIIGGGPAGLAAGVYAVRAGAKPVLFEQQLPGGRVNYTDIVENYPGFEPTSGMELALKLVQHAQRFGVEIRQEKVERLTVEKGVAVETSKGSYEAPCAIIATGTRAKTLGVDGEKELLGRGISLCAVCDGPLYKGKEVVVVGGGDSALTEALFLTRFVERVHLVHRRDEFRGAATLVQRVRNNEKITLHLSRVVKRFESEGGKLKRVVLASTKGEPDQTLEVEGAFLYVGNTPNTEFLEVKLEQDRGGYIVTDERMRTSVERLFAAGDVRAKVLRQIATAVADGAVAAVSAVEEWLH